MEEWLAQELSMSWVLRGSVTETVVAEADAGELIGIVRLGVVGARGMGGLGP